MKGYQKRWMAIAFALILAMSNAIMVSADGNATMIQRQDVVEGHSAINAEKTTNMVLNVKRKDDTFKVYDLTKITWTETDGVLNATIEWNDAVKTFLTGNAEFAGDQFSTPEKLGAAKNESDVIKLLKAMREDATLMATLEADYKAAYHTGVNESEGNSTVDASKVPVKQASVTPNMVGEELNQTFNNAYTISGLQYGLYFVDAKGTTREYQPVMVDLMPVQTGPTGNWYIKNDLSASLKYEDINVIKQINTKSEDVVREGELVSFTVEVEVPQYTKDAGGNYLSGSSLFNGFDIMERGFSLIATSAKIYYYDAAGKMYHPTAQLTLDSSNGNMTVKDTEQTYSANVAANSFVYYLTNNSTENVFYSTPTETAGTVKFWGNVNGELIDLGRYTDDTTASYNAALSTLNQKRTAAGLTTLSGTVAKRDYVQSVISIKFDYTKLMDSATYSTASNTNGFTVPDKYLVTYDAQINTDFIVGEDTNTNKVTISYVGDSAGNIETVETDVRAWTYAANVKKIDGTTGGFLEDAIFDLYRLDTVYCGGSTATTEPTDSEYSAYQYYTDAEGITEYSYSIDNWKNVLSKAVQYDMTQQGITEAATIQSKVSDVLTALTDGGGYETADKFSKKYEPLTSNLDYMAMLQKWVLPKVSAGSMLYQAIPVKVDGCNNHAGEHYHIEYYSTMWTGIESAAIADGDKGVTLVGLDPNTYLLIETKAPDNYNKMTGAVQFAINQYNGEQYTAAGNSYKGFIRDDAQDEVDGIYDITVENFQGLQLPSTGGMGTLLFTILGIGIMFIAIIVIVLKSRKRDYEYL